MTWAKLFEGRMSKHSAQILELLHHLVFSLSGECISLSFHLSFVCVLAVISGLYGETLIHGNLFTYVYDTLQIILMREIISINL